MRRVCLTLSWLAMMGVAYSQEASPDTAKIWENSLVGAVTLSQVAFKDWAQGGESALAWTLIFDGKSAREGSRTNWTTSYKTAFGQTRQGGQGFRKTDDKIDLETVLTYKVGTYVNPFVSATLKTQFAKGVQYDDQGVGTEVSQFFDPAYLTQSAGAGYEPVKQVKTRLGFGLRETITRRFNAFSDDPATPQIEEIKTEAGFEWVTALEWSLASNIIFNGKFETFAPLGAFDKPILRSDTTLTMKVNRFITTNINVQMLRDLQVSSRTQIKQALAVGISYSVF
jgi:hypothetical protein